MAIDRRTEMSAEETDAFLGRHETGVLTLARGNDPYAIPISYGYDVGEREFVLRLVSKPDSEKRRFLRDEPPARLVIYAESGDVYRSVIAEGALERIEPSALTTRDIEQYGAAKRPLFEIWAEAKADLDIELYRLPTESLNGRRIEVSRETP